MTESEHFHSRDKGCVVEEKLFPAQKSGLRGSGFTRGAFCKTHQKDLCRCGWEWHWHYGIQSRPPRDKKEEKKRHKTNEIFTKKWIENQHQKIIKKLSL